MNRRNILQGTRTHGQSRRATLSNVLNNSEKPFPQNESTLSQFSFIWEGSRTGVLDATDCVSIIRVRANSTAGVDRLAKLMDRRDGDIAGHTSAGPLPVVAQVPHDHLNLIEEYLVEEKGMSEEEANLALNSRSRKWYAIVDGNHLHEALILQAERNSAAFAGFPWRVHIINWQSIRTLKGFARARNLMQREELLVEMTLYDTIRSLKDIAIEEALHRGRLLQYDDVVKERGFNKLVADGFCGLDGYADATIASSLALSSTFLMTQSRRLVRL